MGFDELAPELDKTYDFKYTDREKGLREFGNKYEPDLRQAMASGRTLKELAEAAQIGDAHYWSGYIREGMGIAAYLREIEN